MPILISIFQSVKTKQVNALDKMKSKFIKEQNALVKHRQVWECKLNELNAELNTVSDKIYHIISQARRTIQGQIDKTAPNEADMQNYIKELEECNSNQSDELKAALKDKRVADKSTRSAKVLAKSRLKKWHDKRNLNRLLLDELVDQ